MNATTQETTQGDDKMATFLGGLDDVPEDTRELVPVWDDETDDDGAEQWTQD